MPITRTAMIDDDGSGTTGTILNNAWKQELYNQIDGQFVVGTWTPTLGAAAGSGVTYYVSTAGRYMKIDRRVDVWGRITLSSKGTLSGSLTIGGLPFAAVSGDPMSVGYWAGMVTAITVISGYTSGSTLLLRKTTTPAVATGILDAADITGAFDIIFACSYLTA